MSSQENYDSLESEYERICGRCAEILEHEREMDRLDLEMQYMDFDDYQEAQVIYRAMMNKLDVLEGRHCSCELIQDYGVQDANR